MPAILDCAIQFSHSKPSPLPHTPAQGHSPQSSVAVDGGTRRSRRHPPESVERWWFGRELDCLSGISRGIPTLNCCSPCLLHTYGRGWSTASTHGADSTSARTATWTSGTIPAIHVADGLGSTCRLRLARREWRYGLGWVCEYRESHDYPTQVSASARSAATP